MNSFKAKVNILIFINSKLNNLSPLIQNGTEKFCLAKALLFPSFFFFQIKSVKSVTESQDD